MTTIDAKPKERRIVTWTQQEDDILREQISIHGTENWTIIASKFKDKTTRQCRRRWYTYLNSDFKKGGWSPEEDMLLCEAQKIYGNRWTEIAKVVSGRTDNAVKNRFSTLCKKRAKHEVMAKENSNPFVNVNNKRVLIDNGFHSSPLKKLRRAHIPHGAVANCYSVKQELRTPFAILDQNVNKSMIATNKDEKNKIEGAFLSKNDPKVAALMQQAELLSSLAVKVNIDNTEQSLENAWKVLQNFFRKGKDSDEIRYKTGDMDLQFDDLKNLMEELRSNNERINPLERKRDLYDSPSSSEYSTASEHGEQSLTEICTMNGTTEICTMNEFSSPIQVTPLFRSLASTIPSPQFSESERHFLLRTLGIDSPTPNTMINAMKPPPCRKALLQGL